MTPWKASTFGWTEPAEIRHYTDYRQLDELCGSGGRRLSLWSRLYTEKREPPREAALLLGRGAEEVAGRLLKFKFNIE